MEGGLDKKRRGWVRGCVGVRGGGCPGGGGGERWGGVRGGGGELRRLLGE